MIETFLITLTPMLTLFSCIAIGFILEKARLVPENAGITIAKLETMVFCPALNFITMARYFTLSSLLNNLELILISTVIIILAVFVAIFLSRFFVKEKSVERGIYQYALTFANFGFLGDPLVLAMFGDKMLFLYKLFTLPMSIVTYTWGINAIIPSDKGENPFKKLLNPPLIAMLLGMIVGIFGFGNSLPEFAYSALDSLKACMGPLAMILAGLTVARFNVLEMLTNKKVYIATAMRLIVLPAVYVLVTFGIVSLINALFSLNIGTAALFLLFFSFAGPLGLNTIVFPEAYGGNPKTGASMAMISHTLCVITIPIMYALMVLIFGVPTV